MDGDHPMEATGLNYAVACLHDAIGGPLYFDTAGAAVALTAMECGGRMTLELLQSTGAGKLVASLKKHREAPRELSRRARRLVSEWKDQILASSTPTPSAAPSYRIARGLPPQRATAQQAEQPGNGGRAASPRGMAVRMQDERRRAEAREEACVARVADSRLQLHAAMAALHAESSEGDSPTTADSPRRARERLGQPVW